MTGATSPMLRRLNAQAVLDALLDADPAAGLSGADLMDATRLSRPTVHAVCDELIARGWLTELDALRPADSSRPGRRARVYAPLPGAGHVLGVDMGATTVRAAVADLRGTVLGEDAAAFRHDRVPAGERIAATRAACLRAAERAGVTALLGAAVGVPSPVADGRVAAVDDYLPGLAAEDLRLLLDPLPLAVEGPVLVDNDANLALLAERWTGAAADADDAVLVLAGERLGAGICVDGRIVRGHRGRAGELGFLDLVAGVGDTAAVGNLARRWGTAALGRPVRAEDVAAAARAGDDRARAVLRDVARRTARVLAVLAVLLDPEVIVIGGGAAGAADVLLDPLEQELGALTPRTPRLVASALAERGVLLGAVRAALDDVRPRLLDLAPA